MVHLFSLLSLEMGCEEVVNGMVSFWWLELLASVVRHHRGLVLVNLNKFGFMYRDMWV